jgi:hypothetical protein
MNRCQSFFAYAALLIGVITFASSFARPTSGQAGSSTAPTVGRYQPSAAAYPNNAPSLFVTDTQTGRTWLYSNGGQGWTDLGTPPTTK